MVEQVGQRERLVRLYALAFRLDPTNVQAGWFARSAGARRWCLNQVVAFIAENHRQSAAKRARRVDPRLRVKPLSAMDLRNALKKDRPDWLAELSVWVLEFAEVDGATASSGFLPVGRSCSRRGSSRRPRRVPDVAQSNPS